MYLPVSMKILLQLVILLTVASISLFAMMTYKTLKERELDQLARFQCAQSSRFTMSTSDSIVVWYPIEDLYAKCLAEMKIL